VAYTYILKCSDDTYYTGWTKDLEKRLKAHNSGAASKYTRARLPVSLIYYECFDSDNEAMSREAEIKKLSRKEKEKLININKQGGIIMSREIMLEKKVWAVIGATQNTEKFGYKIYKRLKEREYEVYPVNPVCENIDGDKCFKDLSSLPKVPEVINMVVAPERGKAYIEEAAALGIKYVWFQPGTYDNEILRMAKDKGMEILLDCVLVATNQ